MPLWCGPFRLATVYYRREDLGLRWRRSSGNCGDVFGLTFRSLHRRQTYLPTGSCTNTRGNDLCHNLGTVPAVTGSFLTSGLVVFVVEPLQVVLALAELARFFGNVVHAVGW